MTTRKATLLQTRILTASLWALLLPVGGSLPGQAQIDAKTDAKTDGPPVVPPAKTSDALPLPPQGNPAPTDLAKPVLPAGGGSQYVLEFNRSPVIGHRLKLHGIYDEARIQFTRPRNWQTKDARLLLRFRHSPALYATRSNLTVIVNGTNVGSVPLNYKKGELASSVYPIPARVLQDYNEVVIAALQNNSPTCTQDPFDPSLWTEVLPDSKLVLDYQPQAIDLDFSRYPYPLFDTLSLEPNRIAYRLPETLDETWLTGTARLHAALGRLAQYRPLETRVLQPGETAQPGERLVVIGTPTMQPSLAQLKLPLAIKAGQLLDQQQQPLPPDVGVLMLTPSSDGKNLVLVATGNGVAGVAKATQFLVQARDRQIGTGQTIMVKQLDAVPSPPPRDWPAFLPSQNAFQFKDLKDYNSRPLSDITVRGADAPVVEVDFKALPDDRFDPGSTVNLLFSYSAQVNTLTSMVEVQLDGVPITGKRLDSDKGALRDQLMIPLPAERVKPYSKLQVRFQLDPRERRSCNRATDQQLWGTVHADTKFEINRHQSVQIPDLQLLQYGYPFAAPQDLSSTAIALPDRPTPTDVLVLLGFAERLGRLSRAESLQFNVYRANQLPEAEKQDKHLVAIGTQAQFPLPQAFQAPGFRLQDLFARQREQSTITTLPDDQGVVKEIVSPWNSKRVLLALSGQTDQGLQQLRALFSQDDLFFQLRADTVLIKANRERPSPYERQTYTLEALQNSPQTQEITDQTPQAQVFRLIQNSWFLLAPGTLIAALVLYGVFQTYLNRVGRKGAIGPESLPPFEASTASPADQPPANGTRNYAATRSSQGEAGVSVKTEVEALKDETYWVMLADQEQPDQSAEIPASDDD